MMPLCEALHKAAETCKREANNWEQLQLRNVTEDFGPDDMLTAFSRLAAAERAFAKAVEEHEAHVKAGGLCDEQIKEGLEGA